MLIGLCENVAVHPGKMVRRLRADRDWSLEELADKAGIHKMNLSKLERGLVDPRIGTLQKIAAAFEIPVTALVFIEDVTGSDIATESTDAVKDGADVSATVHELRISLGRMEIFLSGALEEIRRTMADLDTQEQAAKSPRKRA